MLESPSPAIACLIASRRSRISRCSGGISFDASVTSSSQKPSSSHSTEPRCCRSYSQEQSPADKMPFLPRLGLLCHGMMCSSLYSFVLHLSTSDRDSCPDTTALPGTIRGFHRGKYGGTRREDTEDRGPGDSGQPRQSDAGGRRHADRRARGVGTARPTRKRYAGKGVQKAVANVNEVITPRLRGKDAARTYHRRVPAGPEVRVPGSGRRTLHGDT